MASELEAVVREASVALDRRDFERVLQLVADDAQGVDEVSRRWLRGRDELAAHTRQIEAEAHDLRSELRDVHETAWGDTGLVTGWLEQDYTLRGERQHVSAPVTVVLRRGGGGWRIALSHAIPLPAGAGA